jgi:hypothetical protein
LILCGQIYGSGLGRHGPTKARHGLGPGWATVFTLWAGTARPKKCLGFSGPNPFDTKHDGLGPGWPGLAQFPALGVTVGLLYRYEDQMWPKPKAENVPRPGPNSACPGRPFFFFRIRGRWIASFWWNWSLINKVCYLVYNLIFHQILNFRYIFI